MSIDCAENKKSSLLYDVCQFSTRFEFDDFACRDVQNLFCSWINAFTDGLFCHRKRTGT